MAKHSEIVGSSKTLSKSITKMRSMLGTRGPWKKSVPLRDYHDELLKKIALAPAKRLRLERN